ncbi:hypothetical protein Agub_g9626, partial [Astrephomene gubernaculifera]
MSFFSRTCTPQLKVFIATRNVQLNRCVIISNPSSGLLVRPPSLSSTSPLLRGPDRQTTLHTSGLMFQFTASASRTNLNTTTRGSTDAGCSSPCLSHRLGRGVAGYGVQGHAPTFRASNPQLPAAMAWTAVQYNSRTSFKDSLRSPFKSHFSPRTPQLQPTVLPLKQHRPRSLTTGVGWAADAAITLQQPEPLQQPAERRGHVVDDDGDRNGCCSSSGNATGSGIANGSGNVHVEYGSSSNSCDSRTSSNSSSRKKDFILATRDEDTIASIVTGMSHGSVAIIRISGSDAVAIASKVFRPGGRVRADWRPESHRVYYGTAVDPEGRLLDEVLLLVMRSPRSYTAEDVAELHCHGGGVCAARVLGALQEAG